MWRRAGPLVHGPHLPLLALRIIIYLGKVIVWDKVLGLGSADPITGMVADWAGIIVTAYVGGRTIEMVSRISGGEVVRLFHQSKINGTSEHQRLTMLDQRACPARDG
jgi:hypothetical protein